MSANSCGANTDLKLFDPCDSAFQAEHGQPSLIQIRSNWVHVVQGEGRKLASKELTRELAKHKHLAKAREGQKVVKSSNINQPINQKEQQDCLVLS